MKSHSESCRSLSLFRNIVQSSRISSAWCLSDPSIMKTECIFMRVDKNIRNTSQFNNYKHQPPKCSKKLNQRLCTKTTKMCNTIKPSWPPSCCRTVGLAELVISFNKLATEHPSRVGHLWSVTSHLWIPTHWLDINIPYVLSRSVCSIWSDVIYKRPLTQYLVCISSWRHCLCSYSDTWHATETDQRA